MEARLFEQGTIPEWTTPEWYAGRETAPHLEQEGHRQRLLLTRDMCLRAYRSGARNVADLGAGDGGLLSTLTNFDSAVGYDLQQTNVDAAKLRGVDVQLHDVVAELPVLPELAVATEMLEHLIDPHGFVRRVHAAGATWLVASSPYTETAESHYDFHTWAWDLTGYRVLLENNGWRVLRQETAWISQVLLATRKGD